MHFSTELSLSLSLLHVPGCASNAAKHCGAKYQCIHFCCTARRAGRRSWAWPLRSPQRNLRVGVTRMPARVVPCCAAMRRGAKGAFTSATLLTLFALLGLASEVSPAQSRRSCPGCAFTAPLPAVRHACWHPARHGIRDHSGISEISDATSWPNQAAAAKFACPLDHTFECCVVRDVLLVREEPNGKQT